MSTQAQAAAVNITGFIIRGGDNLLFLDRNKQWRRKPGAHEAWVHTTRVVNELHEKDLVNGRKPDAIIPARYDGNDTIPTGEPQPW